MSSGEVPEGRCGFVLEPGDVHEDVAVEFEAGSDRWYEASDAVCCWRKVWDGGDGERCVWHAESDDKPADALIDARADNPERLDGGYVPDVELGDAIDFDRCGLWAATFDGTHLQETSFAGVQGWFAEFPDAGLWEAKFPDADLRFSQFSDARLTGAQFPDTYLLGAQFSGALLASAKFPDANLEEAQFSNANLTAARFPDANLTAAQFPDANLSKADFSNANLFRSGFTSANLTEAVLNGANLSWARIHTVDFSETEINGETRFGKYLWLEREAPYMDQPADAYNTVARAYYRLRTLFTENGLAGWARTYYVAQRRARRKEAWAAGAYTRAVASWLSWLVTGYGTSVRRIVLNMVLVLVAGTVAYAALLDGISGPVGAESGTMATIANSLYFSIITFTTVGYGELAPVSAPVRAVASVEAFAGTVLMVLLGFVLANREV